MIKLRSIALRGVTGVACAIALLMAQATADPSYPFSTVTLNSVNLRKGASKTAALVDELKEGQAVTVTGESGDWYAVTVNGRTGYVMKEFISLDASVVVTVAPTVEPVAYGYPYATVTTAKAAMYAKADRNSTRLDTIPKGAEVQMLSLGRTFAHLTYQGVEGYVVKENVELLKVVKPTAAPATPVPTSPVSSASEYHVLEQGASGSAVIALQSALKELGFYSGAVDGQFGKSTASAVTAFQEKNKYPATGIVDANLQAFLYSGTPKNISGVKTSVKTLAPVEGVTIRAGAIGELVGTVQIRLRDLGYYGGDITMTYDTATQSAVKAFQKAHGLKADGKAGSDTQALLFSQSVLPSGATPTPAPTPSPTPAPTFNRPVESVHKGSVSIAARLVQQRLKELGYLSGKVDGNFGTDSVEALIAFQKKHDLKADGVAGDKTYDILFSYQALTAEEIPTPAPTSTPAPTALPTATPLTPENAVVIKLGVVGREVGQLQQRLTTLGYYIATVDNICKADDVAAIKAFQQKNGLHVDGAAGYETQAKLYASSAVMYSGAMAGGTVDTYETLRLGMTGEAVQTLQKRLIELKYMTGKANGTFDAGTASALIAFQKANKLTTDGVAGAKTLEKLYAANASPAVTPSPAAASADGASTVLKQGDKGAQVTSLQKRLIELGYLNGRADGTFGNGTLTALLAFQKANGLTQDGIAGASTLSKLNSASAVTANGSVAAATAAPETASAASTSGETASASTTPTASRVRYANWYTEVKSVVRQFQYATVYDFSTGISWQVHMFSFGAHADAEPLTASDTAKMLTAFGGNTWNPKPVWVVLGNGTVYMASTHSFAHEVQHIRDNNFEGHLCIHFPRTEEQVTSIGVYATSHQQAIDRGWQTTQAMMQ